ncbi:hypothetical protein U9M48_000466 [Paspalum notatum var. saurae]|uniref:Uncharacterized protein n=1 Tax=Paspalum notatum var. saurae TaxID=547442 RepID=A0AAQ3PGV4_PASNO
MLKFAYAPSHADLPRPSSVRSRVSEPSRLPCFSEERHHENGHAVVIRRTNTYSRTATLIILCLFGLEKVSEDPDECDYIDSTRGHYSDTSLAS